MGEYGRKLEHWGGDRREWEGIEDEGNETFYFMYFNILPVFFFLSETTLIKYVFIRFEFLFSM